MMKFLFDLNIFNEIEWLFNVNAKIEIRGGHAMNGRKLIAKVTYPVITGIGKFNNSKIITKDISFHVWIMKLISLGQIPTQVLIGSIIVGEINIEPDPTYRIAF